VAALLAAVGDPGAEPAVLEAEPGFDPLVLDLIGDASTTYRVAQADRAARLEALLSQSRNRP
jgi:hypothetical protein